MKAYNDHYERLATDHADRTYQFLSDSMDKVIRERRHQQNTQSLAAGSAFNKKTALPGTTPTDPQGGKGDQKGGKGTDSKGNPKNPKDPKGDPKGGKNDKGGKSGNGGKGGRP